MRTERTVGLIAPAFQSSLIKLWFVCKQNSSIHYVKKLVEEMIHHFEENKGLDDYRGQSTTVRWINGEVCHWHSHRFHFNIGCGESSLNWNIKRWCSNIFDIDILRIELNKLLDKKPMIYIRLQWTNTVKLHLQNFRTNLFCAKIRYNLQIKTLS